MHIEHLVNVCLEAIAQGDSIESCLARFPAEAEELEPLLRVAAMLQARPKPTLSPHAFSSGRSALAAAARTAQRTGTGAISQRTSGKSAASAPATDNHSNSDNHSSSDNQISSRQVLDRSGPALPLHSPQDAINENGYHTAYDRANGFGGSKTPNLRTRFQSQSAANQPVRRALTQRTEAQPGLYQVQSTVATRSGKRFRFHHLVTMAASILLMLGGVTLLQQSAQSRPGTPLYAIRTLGQQVEGLLMNAAGEGASWHARQTLSQLESFHMATTGSALTAQLRTDIENHVQQALLAASRLSTEEQERFYADWLTDLAVARATMREADPDAIILLDEVMAQVTTAANGVNILEVTPVTTSTQEPGLSLLVPTVVPTVVPTGTAEAEMATSVATTSATASPPSSPTTPANGAAEVAPAAVNGGNGNARATDVPVVATRVLLATAVPTSPPTATPQRRMQAAATVTLTPTTTPLPVITRVMPRQTEESERNNEALDESSTDGAVDKAPIASAPAQRDDGRDNGADNDNSEDETVPITETMFAPGGTIPQPTPTEPTLGGDDEIAPDDLTAVPTVTPGPPTTATPQPVTEPLPVQSGTPAVTTEPTATEPTATAVADERQPPNTTATAVDEVPTTPPNTATWTPIARATVDETTSPPVETTPEATVDAPSAPPTEAGVTHSRRPTTESVSVTPNPTATPQPTATNEPTRAQQTRRARNNDPDTAAPATPTPASTAGVEPTETEFSVEQPTAEVTSVPAIATSDPVGG